ncbi:MAG: hypothetical protein V4623_09015 [Pseudomonadota bacterium]
MNLRGPVTTTWDTPCHTAEVLKRLSPQRELWDGFQIWDGVQIATAGLPKEQISSLLDALPPKQQLQRGAQERKMQREAELQLNINI